jgi:hypothetical protein
MESEKVVYKGLVFTRYPNSPRRHHRVYYWPTKTWREKGVKALHVEIYLDNVGPIPEGWHVHHKNHDPLDNDPGNLQALPPAEHFGHHAAEEDGWGRWEPEVMADLQEKAKAWHASPEGLEWHSRHGKETWENREEISVGPCFGCGEEVWSYMSGTKGEHRWCSRACFAKHAYHDGRYDTEKVCEWCGNTFMAKHIRVRYCSRSCGARGRWHGSRGMEPLSSGDS